MIYNVLDAAAQLTEEIISGTRAYIMQKHNSALEVDDQHRRLVEAIISGDRNQAEKLMREHHIRYDQESECSRRECAKDKWRGW